LVAVSEGVATELRGAYPNMSDRVSVIPNGVDRETFRPSAVLRDQVREELGLSASELVAAFVGGEWERKGLRHAIEGLAGAPDWRLIILGEGDQPSYERLSVGGGTASRVHFLGRRTDVARVLAAADAFVLPTEYEAFPLVVLEAAAAGLPLLVSRVNGAVDLIKEGENGFFIGRDAASITEALAALGVNPALRSAQATAARASTEAYGWDRVVEAYGDLLSELTRRSCARGSPSARTPL
jgi:UDP-glucose:(heptosyl)LPS alpha-1,3-glucosyltransferase